MIYLTCTGEDVYFCITERLRGPRESFIEPFSTVLHFYVVFRSHVTCASYVPPGTTLHFFGIAAFTLERPSTSRSAEATADVSTNTPTSPEATNGHHMSQLGE